MLTPRFELSQTEDNLTILIHAPYANVAETETSVETNTFLFYSAPYYLRLHLPGNIQETEESSGKYDSDNGDFTFVFQKETKGENFPNLDFGTYLLTPTKTSFPPQIEVIGKSTCTEEADDVDDEECESFDWYIDQNITEENPIGGGQSRYGFADEHSGIFINLHWEAAEILDLPQPDSIPATLRSSLKLERELADFSTDHYFADMMECDVIEPFLKYRVSWYCKDIKFTDAEQDVIKELPRREYLLSKEQRKTLYLGLIDILGAYCYNHRTTLGENTVESAWTINKISGTLSWFQSFTSLRDVIISIMRRCLCYPLYRHWTLAVQIIDDLKQLLTSGKKHILRCLVEIHSLFNKSEPSFLLNKLYITDYCVWIQGANDKVILTLATAIGEMVINKNDVIFELKELEEAAWLVAEEEQNEDKAQRPVLEEAQQTESQITDIMAKLALKENTVNPDIEDCISSGESDNKDTDSKIISKSDDENDKTDDHESTPSLDSDDDDDSSSLNNSIPLDSDDTTTESEQEN